MGTVIVLLVIAVPLAFLAVMVIAVSSGSGEAKDPEAAMSKAFTGEVATWQLTVGGLNQHQVVAGATKRGYRLTAPAGSNGVLTFERQASAPAQGPLEPQESPVAKFLRDN